MTIPRDNLKPLFCTFASLYNRVRTHALTSTIDGSPSSYHTDQDSDTHGDPAYFDTLASHQSENGALPLCNITLGQLFCDDNGVNLSSA